jgi:alanine dehydrogenase
LIDDVHLRNGINIFDGKVTHPLVAEAVGMSLQDVECVLGI